MEQAAIGAGVEALGEDIRQRGADGRRRGQGVASPAFAGAGLILKRCGSEVQAVQSGGAGWVVVLSCMPAEGPMTETRKLAAILVADVVGYRPPVAHRTTAVFSAS